jgi:Ca2+-binding EF-hand superfamily protein
MRYLICMLTVMALSSARAASEAPMAGAGAEGEIECSCQVTDVGEQFWNPDIQSLFTAIDRNQDGRLEAGEWMELRQKIDQGVDPAKPADPQLKASFNDKMALMLNGDRNKIIADCIKDFDKDKDGKLSDDERTSMLVSLVDQEQMLKRFDKNHDGTLSDTEREVAVTQPREGTVDKMISDADTNRDGTLGPAEGLNLLAIMGQNVKDNLSSFMDYFDADRDGQLSDKERESARVALTAAYQQQEKRMLDRFDANKDGKLDMKEREAALDGRQPEVRCVCIIKQKDVKPADMPADPVKKTSMK